MATFKRVEYIAEKLALGSIKVAVGVAELVPYLAMKAYVLLGFLFIGIILIEMRHLFLEMIPWLLRFSKPITMYLNYLMFLLQIVFDACIVVIDGIIEVVDAIHNLFSRHKVHAHLINWVSLPKLSDQEIRAFLSEIPPICTKYNSIAPIFQFVVRYNVHKYTCPAVRYMYPLTWLYDASASILSWTYYGSAAPFVDVAGENCELVTDSAADYICVGLGTGYIILELLLPIFLVYMIITKLGSGLGTIAGILIYGAGIATETAVQSIYFIISELGL